MRKLSVSEWVLAVLGAMALWGAPLVFAQSTIPSGSYLSSCQNVQVVDGVLRATCNMADGTPRETIFPNPYGCSSGIDNINGRLQCHAAPVANEATSRDYAGEAFISNTCSNGQPAVFVIKAGMSVDFVVIELQPGERTHIGVLKGATYTGGCGTFAKNTINLQAPKFNYFHVTPTN